MSANERALLKNAHTNAAFPLFFPLEGEYEFPEAVLGVLASREELASTIAGARNVYAQAGSLSCLYYSLIPSFLLCLCFCVVPLICIFEKKRDKSVREYLEACNEATFEARGIRFDLEVRNGVWIVVDRVAVN